MNNRTAKYLFDILENTFDNTGDALKGSDCRSELFAACEGIGQEFDRLQENIDRLESQIGRLESRIGNR